MTKSNLIQSLWHTGKLPMMSGMGLACTQCQNNCRLGLERKKAVTVDYNCCNNWNEGLEGSFSWLRDVIMQKGKLTEDKVQGSDKITAWI